MATGIETTFFTSSNRAPLRPTRHCATSSSSSRTIHRSWAKISWSRVTLTVPSIEFSSATSPTSALRFVDCVKDLPEAPQREAVGGGQVRLAYQRLLSEGALRPEVGDGRGGRNLHFASIGLAAGEL